MTVSLPKYACAVRTASLMNENLTAASLKYVDAVRFADLTKQEMTASTPERANAVTCPLNAKFVELCPLSRTNRKAEPGTRFLNTWDIWAHGVRHSLFVLRQRDTLFRISSKGGAGKVDDMIQDWREDRCYNEKHRRERNNEVMK